MIRLWLAEDNANPMDSIILQRRWEEGRESESVRGSHLLIERRLYVLKISLVNALDGMVESWLHAASGGEFPFGRSPR